MNQLVQRLASGPPPWGTVQVWPASPGLWERIRLTVYPPGTSRAERRAMEFAHAWPITGALAGFIAIVALSGAAPIVATTAIVVIYLLGFWIGARLTRELRRRSRTLTASTVFIAGELTEFGDVQLLKDTRARLGDLEMRRVRGDIDPILYETEWADVYSSIPSEPLLALNP